MAPLNQKIAEARERVRLKRATLKSSPDALRLHHERLRAQCIESRNEKIGSRDLVTEVLSHPSPNEVPDIKAVRDVLFGRASYFADNWAMTRRITNNALHHVYELILAAADPESKSTQMPALLDPWKLVICDLRYIEEGASVQQAYEAQLQEEEFQVPKERARELIRSEEEKTARRNAKWVIPVLERLSSDELSQMEQEEGGATLAIWKQVAPAPPPWVQHIIDTQQPWGFVFYKTRLVERRYGYKWEDVWDKIVQNTYDIAPRENDRALSFANLGSIHCRGGRSILKELWTEHWAPALPASVLTNDDALRRHFEDYQESLTSPGILRNIFITIDAEPMDRDLWKDSNNNYDIFWVWAYDAYWVPSTNDTAPNGEKYQGRVKVPINCLDAWFYAACWEGVSLRDMWFKAQSHPEKLWICYSKPMEAWQHESYT